MIFSFSNEQLIESGAVHTAQEISRQPAVWVETYHLIRSKTEEIDAFIKGILAKHQQVRVILSGAGTSSFIGHTILPYLQKITDGHVFSMESIATTDLVSNPGYFLKKNEPTILISFSRSGSSPESVASVELTEQLVDNSYHIVLTCSPEAKLAKKAEAQTNTLLLLLPPDANDQGFAMTASFTSMMLAALLIFDRNRLKELENVIELIAKLGKNIIAEKGKQIDEIAKVPFKKIVYLGSGVFSRLAQEAALKMLELTGGDIPVSFDSSLGFRHGPKSIMDADTLVVVFLSNHPYTRKYDLDILREISKEESKGKLVSISGSYDEEAEKLCDWFLYHEDVSSLGEEDVYLTFVHVLYAQILALEKSMLLGFLPDNPSPSGSVNRVVQGVTIYKFEP